MSTAEPKRGRGRPSLGPRARIELQLPAPLVDLLRRDAERRGITITEWLRRASLRELAASHQADEGATR